MKFADVSLNMSENIYSLIISEATVKVLGNF